MSVLLHLRPLPLALALVLAGDPGPVPRIVRGPYLQPSSAGTATVVWYTDVAAEGSLEWSEEGGSWTGLPDPGGAKRRHEVTFEGLREGVPYAYRILGGGAVLADLGNRTEFRFDAPAASTLRLIAFGDSGAGGTGQMSVARAIVTHGPPADMVLVTGDVVYPHGDDADYDAKFFGAYGPLLSRVPFYAAIGNHDYEANEGRPYLEVFNLPRNGPPELIPETIYSFERSNVHFTVHDSNLPVEKLRPVVAPWHVADVRASSARFRIAVLHHSPYSSGLNSVLPPTPMVREFFSPLFANTGIDLVLAGHDHQYERSRPIGGVVYVTTGAGGHDLYPRVSTNAFTEVFYGLGGRHSYTAMEVTGRILSLRQIDVAGCVVDTMGLDKAIGEADTWRVWRGTAAPNPSWAAPDFDDQAWPALPAAIGYGAPDLSTAIPDMQGSHLALYLRNTFSLGASGRVDDLMLRIRYDDGFVAYLNGIEVARRNVPEGQGPGTPAAASHSSHWFETIRVPASLLRLGPNVLAVEGHNRTLGDASFVLAPELTLLAGERGSCP